MSNAVHNLERDLERAREIAESGLILRTTVGSVVHGLSNPGTDDRDELGVTVPEPERTYLRSVRAGELPLEDVLARLDAVTVELEEIAANAALPAKADVAVIDDFLVRTYRAAWG